MTYDAAPASATPHSVPELLTTAEVAEQYRVPESTLRFWRHAAVGPRSSRVGRRVFYSRADCDAWWQAEMERTARGGAPVRP